ncbi:MAG: 2,5-didehydrogluconate reductase [Microvirga sp.]|jgi:diketogulonate reductase-like aldo/keto reductase|nr:2,5-didehydrogluconate reductase [Microvirga sp.]
MDEMVVKANGAEIPAIGLGTWQLRGEEGAAAVKSALEAGYRHIDTAAMYGNEEAVGEGLRASGVARDEVFVTTKVWPEDLAPADLRRSAEASLKRLGLSQVDLLLIHWPNAAIPLAGTIRALCEAKRAGLSRHIGVANFTVRLLDEAVSLADEPIVANQCEYHPYLDQSLVRAECRKHGAAFVSYCPIGKAQVLSEPAIQAIAKAHRRTPAQIVLRWQVQQPGVVAIPKSGDPQRQRENFSVFDFGLTDEEMAAICGLARPGGRMVTPAWSPHWD